MISWRSYTTSKVLPTFVGESITTASTSYSGSNIGVAYGGGTTSSASFSQVFSITISPVLTFSGKTQGDTNVGVYFGAYTRINTDFLDRKTSVNRNSTFYELRGSFNGSAYVGGHEEGVTTSTSPLRTIKQETTEIASYVRNIYQTKTISQEGYEDETFDLVGYIWTVTSSQQTLSNGDTTNITSFFQTTTKTTETVVDYVTTESTRTIVTQGDEVELLTYTAPDGTVEVIAHTIYEGRNAVTVDSPTSGKPVTELSYSPTRFTHSFKEYYTKTLDVRDASLSTNAVTTNSTTRSGHQTTTRSWSNETFVNYYQEYESRTCSNRTGSTVYTETDEDGNLTEYTEFDKVTRTTPFSYQAGFQFSITTDTVINTTTTTFRTFNGQSTVAFTDFDKYTTGSQGTGSTQIRTSTNFVENTIFTETSTFLISGDLLTHSSQDWPGLVDQNVFPWSTTGNGNKRFFNLPNDKTSIITTTTINVNFGHTWNIAAQSNSETTSSRTHKLYSGTATASVLAEGASASTAAFGNKKNGIFFAKLQYSGSKRNQATVVRFAHQNFQGHGLANPSLDFTTDNTHSTLGAFMSANAQHTWAGFPLGQGIERGNIMRGVVGAVPLYPKFSGLIYKDSEGWELCDTSEYTTVGGSRIGKSFTTTITWKTVIGTITQNTTSSGSFTIDSFLAAKVGAEAVNDTIRGGFFTPNASNTIIVSPGAVILLTTYDKQGSGTGSTQYPTGTTYADALNGEVPITISSFIPIAQGYGVFTQGLLDNGMP